LRFFWPILAVSHPFPSFFHPFPLLGAAFLQDAQGPGDAVGVTV